MSDFENLKRSEMWTKGRDLGACIVSFDNVLCNGEQELYEQTQEMLKYVISAYIEGDLQEKNNLYVNAVSECKSLIDVLNNWAKDNYNSFDIVAPIIFKLNDYIDVISIEAKNVRRMSA